MSTESETGAAVGDSLEVGLYVRFETASVQVRHQEFDRRVSMVISESHTGPSARRLEFYFTDANAVLRLGHDLLSVGVRFAAQTASMAERPERYPVPEAKRKTSSDVKVDAVPDDEGREQ